MKRERMLMWIYFGGRDGIDKPFFSNHFFSPFYLHFFFFFEGWKMVDPGRKNLSLPSKISLIFSPPFSILPIFIATKRSLGLRLIAFFFWLLTWKHGFLNCKSEGLGNGPERIITACKNTIHSTKEPLQITLLWKEGHINLVFFRPLFTPYRIA